MRERILDILNIIRPGVDFEGSEDFFEDELIDSFGVLTLISMIESEFEIVIEGEDIGADNFQSLDCIEALICRK